MTPEELAKHRLDPNIAFWKNLKEGTDYFEVDQGRAGRSASPAAAMSSMAAASCRGGRREAPLGRGPGRRRSSPRARPRSSLSMMTATSIPPSSSALMSTGSDGAESLRFLGLDAMSASAAPGCARASARASPLLDDGWQDQGDRPRQPRPTATRSSRPRSPLALQRRPAKPAPAKRPNPAKPAA